MWESICLTLAAAAGNNIGKVLQKKGTVILPPPSFKLKVLLAYAFNRAWAIGFTMDIFGAVLMLMALSQAHVSIVQPVSGCGLAILSIFSHFYLKEILNVIDWVGIVLAGVGTIGVGAGGEEQKVSPLSILQLPCLALVVTILFALLNGWLRLHNNRRKAQELMDFSEVEEIIHGLESGILFGMSSVISKIGFLLLEQGFPKILTPVCISMSMCCSGTGFVYQTRGLKQGRVIVVSTFAAVASIITSVLSGLLALGETLPSSFPSRLMLLFGWVLIVVGVVLLVVSRQLRRWIRWPFGGRIHRRGWARSQRGTSLRRRVTLGKRDESERSSTTSVMHHLVPSISKEKP